MGGFVVNMHGSADEAKAFKMGVLANEADDASPAEMTENDEEPSGELERPSGASGSNEGPPRMPAETTEPSKNEREKHDLLHIARAPWCEMYARGNQLTRAHHAISFGKKDVGHAMVAYDIAFMRTRGAWSEPGDQAPAACEACDAALVMYDVDTHYMTAVSLTQKVAGHYAVTAVVGFTDHLNIGKATLWCDGEPTTLALARAVKAERSATTILKDGPLKDSASMGAKRHRGADPLVASEAEDLACRPGAAIQDHADGERHAVVLARPIRGVGDVDISGTR